MRYVHGRASLDYGVQPGATTERIVMDLPTAARHPSRRLAPSMLAVAMRDGTDLPTPEGRERTPRAFCGIGVCLECETEIDGVIVRACMTEAVL